MENLTMTIWPPNSHQKTQKLSNKPMSRRRMIRYIFSKNQSVFRYIIFTTAFAIAIVYTVLILFDYLGLIQNSASTPSEPIRKLLMLVVINVLITPIFENLLLILSLSLLSELVKSKSILVTVIIFSSAVLHGLAHQWAFVAGGILFGVMAYSYLNYFDKSFWNRFFILFAQHAPATVYCWLTAV
jgi:hypothetical protein